MTAQTRPVPMGGFGGGRSYPLGLYLYFPTGTGSQRGSVVLRNGPKITFDQFTVNKGVNDEEIIMAAVQSILRTAPGRRVRYVVRAVDRREYGAVRKQLDNVFRALRLDAEYGSNHMETEVMSYAAQYAAVAGRWQDMHNAMHTYISTVGNGERNFTSVVHVTARSLHFAEISANGSDPVAANLSALRGSLVNLAEHTNVAVWSGCELVNRTLRRERNLPLSEQAEHTALELDSYSKAHILNLSHNSLISAPLVQMSTFLAVRMFENHVKQMLVASQAPLRLKRKDQE